MSADWPYPFWIAHRGAGKLAPENTAAAFHLGHRLGWRMAECDVKLSADGVPFLLHDDTLERTTSGYGPAAARSWAELSRLDAGAWHSPAHAGQPLMMLAQLAAWSQEAATELNLEIKPCPRARGRDRPRRRPGRAAPVGRSAAAAALIVSARCAGCGARGGA